MAKAMSSLKALFSAVSDKISPKRRKFRAVLKSKDGISKDSPFFDSINHDKLNHVQKRPKLKGEKKFTYDLAIVTMFQMISLYWTQRMTGLFISTNPKPVEYGTMPTVMRRKKRSDIQKQIIHDVTYRGKVYYTYGLKKSQIKSLVRADRAKTKLAQLEKRTNKRRQKAEVLQQKRATYKELIAKYQSDFANGR